MPRGYMQKSCPSGVVRAKGPAVSQDHRVRLADPMWPMWLGVVWLLPVAAGRWLSGACRPMGKARELKMDVWVGRGESSFRGTPESITMTWVRVGAGLRSSGRAAMGCWHMGSTALMRGSRDPRYCWPPSVSAPRIIWSQILA